MNAINTVSIGHSDLNEAVRSTALLADVTISVWGGERSDADVTNKIRNDAGATGDVGRFVKKMLAGHDGLLKDAKSAFAAVRLKHYALTLPWVSDPTATRMTGARLLPNLLFDRYTQDMGQARRAAMAALDAFIVEYPNLVIAARANLGDLADVVYPTPDDVRGKFRVAFDFEPIPAGAAFKGLPDAMLAKLSRSLADKQERMIRTAQGAMWGQVRERVHHLYERMAARDKDGNPAMFKSTTVDHVRELVTLIPAWNILGSPEGAETVDAIDTMLAGVTVDNLRNDIAVRDRVMRDAVRLLVKLDNWGV